MKKCARDFDHPIGHNNHTYKHVFNARELRQLLNEMDDGIISAKILPTSYKKFVAKKGNPKDMQCASTK